MLLLGVPNAITSTTLVNEYFSHYAAHNDALFQSVRIPNRRILLTQRAREVQVPLDVTLGGVPRQVEHKGVRAVAVGVEVARVAVPLPRGDHSDVLLPCRHRRAEQGVLLEAARLVVVVHCEARTVVGEEQAQQGARVRRVHEEHDAGVRRVR